MWRYLTSIGSPFVEVRRSYYLLNEISDIGKMTALYWISPLFSRKYSQCRTSTPPIIQPILHSYTAICFKNEIQYIPRNMHTVFALLCFVVVIHWLIFPFPSGLLHWHCGNLTIAPVPAKQTWWIWTNTSCEFIMNDFITTTKQSTTKPCAYFLGHTVTAFILLGL